MIPHQFVHRESGIVLDEKLFGDRIVNLLYSKTREHMPSLFRALTGARSSALLAWANFDLPLSSKLLGSRRFLESCGVSMQECVEPPSHFTTPRRVFERQIRYWDCRPMSGMPDAVVSPADSRVVAGSFASSSQVYVKDKFFRYEELLGSDREWIDVFRNGDFAIFRLTPDKYHYNHCPVSGRVTDIYEIEGEFHSCNPGAVVKLVTPYSKNKRSVTVIDTDVPEGSRCGKVAMIEVTALMIGEVVQAYSDFHYNQPTPVVPGMFLRKGQPKSFYRPGSSTDILIFEKDKIRFEDDILSNMFRKDVHSRLSIGFSKNLVETDVQVRSTIARTV